MIDCQNQDIDTKNECGNLYDIMYISTKQWMSVLIVYKSMFRDNEWLVIVYVIRYRDNEFMYWLYISQGIETMSGGGDCTSLYMSQGLEAMNDCWLYMR